MDRICIYLRKSRADEEIEKTLGQGETLSKHRKALMKFAKEKKLNIVEIKEEIVSGDSLFFRPKMLELLKEVENGEYSGVLVMDIDRLGRGGMKDQGIILDAFKESSTKIVTPQKTYDLNNELDEEMTEFKTFFSRRELKTINRRMQGGRVRSVESGNYISTNPPLGYDIDYINKSRTLKINEAEADIIKIIFRKYVIGDGASAISNYLNSLGYKTKTANKFVPSSVLFIIRNLVYIGKITWKKRDIKKSRDPNKVKDTRTRDKSEWIVAEGKHQPIIDEDLFNAAQEILNNRYHIPYQLINEPINPLAGLITCNICGKKMTMRPSRGIYRVMCTNKCGNKSTRFDYVEKALIKALEDYLKEYKYSSKAPVENKTNEYEKQLTLLSKELNTLNNQKLKLFDLLERGIYDDKTFLDRSNNVDERINVILKEISNVKKLIKKESNHVNKDYVIYFENIIKSYKNTKDIKIKNKLLKNILYKIEYAKLPEQKNNDFQIKLFPKVLR